ncbi:hypothetical protein BHE74_00044891 [Ensete ventricosum]|nr:hypothetical protein BHE74_00044891 [Ensete ventricosum]RZR85841.1 hypothetical protein BHM03_00012906 [Ensete ventricosum]
MRRVQDPRERGFDPSLAHTINHEINNTGIGQAMMGENSYMREVGALGPDDTVMAEDGGGRKVPAVDLAHEMVIHVCLPRHLHSPFLSKNRSSFFSLRSTAVVAAAAAAAAAFSLARCFEPNTKRLWDFIVSAGGGSVRIPKRHKKAIKTSTPFLWSPRGQINAIKK